MFEIGSSLREARTRQGLELSDAEAATKIRVRYLEALEDERFDLLPAQTYVKGFLRAYAEYLGLDGQLYVDEFNSRFADGEDDLPTPMRPPRPRSGRQVESAVVLVALAGIVAVTALVVVAFAWTGSPEERAPTALQPPARTDLEARRKGGSPWFSLRVVAARGATALTVRRRSRTGRVLFEGTLERGSEMTFTGARLWLRASAPQNLELRLDGRRTTAAAGRRTLVATARGVRPVG